MRCLGLVLVTSAAAIAALPTGAAAQSGRLDLPVVAIDAPEGIVDDPKRAATMRVLDRDRREDYSGRIGIELRGLTSQYEEPKNPYTLETRKRSGANLNVSLLGMPADDDWVLIASYSDESLLRNLVAYEAARWAGRYAARTRLVELVVNGSYEGAYLLAEQLKLHESRVAVDDSDISGGYLLEMTSTKRLERTPASEQFFTTPVESQAVVYEDPNPDDLSYGRAAWIRDYIGRFERRLYGDQFTDRRRGYRRYLDMDAAVDFMLLNELFRNNDTLRWDSTYLHKGVGGKLVLGPLWDFDDALGDYGSEEVPNQTAGFHYGAFAWAERLYADPAFRRRMAARWRDLQSHGLIHHIVRTIDRGARQLARGPAERNFSRWPIPGNLPADPRTGAPPATHADAVDYLKWWLMTRAEWIDSNIGAFGA
jgi:hypothetical protein